MNNTEILETCLKSLMPYIGGKTDLNKLLKIEKLSTEIDLERADQIQYRLKFKSKSNSELKAIRAHLRRLMIEFEKEYWTDEESITQEQITKSDEAEEEIIKLIQEERDKQKPNAESEFEKGIMYGLKKAIKLIEGNKERQ